MASGNQSDATMAKFFFEIGYRREVRVGETEDRSLRSFSEVADFLEVIALSVHSWAARRAPC